jgi:thiol-disulfide isomerase/thioredoxin
LSLRLTEVLGNVKYSNQIVCKLEIGDKLTTINQITPLIFNKKNGQMTLSEKTQNVEFKEGEVVLLDFWGSFCGPCQGPMAHNVEMLKK